jgi:hypothetical protein
LFFLKNPVSDFLFFQKNAPFLIIWYEFDHRWYDCDSPSLLSALRLPAGNSNPFILNDPFYEFIFISLLAPFTGQGIFIPTIHAQAYYFIYSPFCIYKTKDFNPVFGGHCCSR